jgi:hypothetical protein
MSEIDTKNDENTDSYDWEEWVITDNLDDDDGYDFDELFKTK